MIVQFLGLLRSVMLYMFLLNKHKRKLKIQKFHLLCVSSILFCLLKSSISCWWELFFLLINCMYSAAFFSICARLACNKFESRILWSQIQNKLPMQKNNIAHELLKRDSRLIQFHRVFLVFFFFFKLTSFMKSYNLHRN